ncbi:MAG: XRE family transcriptional regulator [Anaerovoracaceae bacterium]|nr:XRE family transcriptional regulator [Anaerovoracaceae bacterium]
MAVSDPKELNGIIADNLKDLRKARDITLDEAAEMTGVSKSMLGQIERGDCGLSVATLWKICTGLKISFTSLMSAGEDNVEIVDNKSVEPLRGDHQGFRIYPVFPSDSGRSFEILYIELDPDGISKSEAHDTGTEEFVMVYEGELSLTVGDDHYDVPSDHSIRYMGDKPHIYANTGKKMTRLCMVIKYPDNM